MRPTRWLWQGRVPVGYLALLLGAEGVGKGTLAAWLVAAVTRGQLPGDLSGRPGRALIVGDEDGFDSVVVPRLFAAGADLDLVDTLHDEDDALDLRRDESHFRATLVEGDYALVYFDALLDVLGADLDDWRSKAVRDAIRPARRAARDLDVAMLGSLHPNKSTKGTFRELVSGSHAFNATSRSSLLLAPHPDDDERRVLVRGKGNLSAAPPSFEFAIETKKVEINAHPFTLPVVTDHAEGKLRVEDLVRGDRPVRSTLADEIDQLGTGETQTRAEIARSVGRASSDRSVGRALDQLEADGRWSKEGRGQWRRVVDIGTPIGGANVHFPKAPKITNGGKGGS